MKIAWIGLGAMGFPMAGHLSGKNPGHVAVYNRTKAKAETWAARFPGSIALTPADAARDADFIFCCVGNDDDLRSVCVGPDGAFASLKPGSVFIDHTTASAEVAREFYAAAQSRSAAFLDAPVSGGQAGAESGTLTVMAGGDPDTFAKAEPLMASYAKAARLIGPSGAGQLAKMVNQICIGGLVAALAEALNFGKASGLDMEQVMAAIGKGAAQSWQMDNRWRTMTEGRFDFGFAVDWMRKDLDICLAEARRNGAPLPVTALVDQLYADVQAMDGGRWDTSSLIARLDANV
jgi:3-hydroxyisobutyrate dehydrogenase-like beta-hydroxyacid dehydrogenase